MLIKDPAGYVLAGFLVLLSFKGCHKYICLKAARLGV